MYRILRDNKERGPLSLDELLALQLKPFDLVWIEGKSAGWRYPSEIDALKPYLEPATDLNQRIADAPVTFSQNHPASQQTRSVNPPDHISSAPIAFSETEEDTELTADKLEKKANEIYLRVQAFAKKQEESQEGTQTKYARSLDDLKQEYADWLHNKKHKKNFKRVSLGKFGIIGAAAACTLLVFAAYLFISGNKKQPESGLKPGQHYISNFESGPNVKPPKNPPPAATDQKLQEPNTDGSLVVRKESSVDEFIDSVRRVLAKGSQRKNPKKYSAPDDAGNGAGTPPTATVIAQPPQEVEKKEISPVKQVSMNARYEQDANKKNISSLEVTIQNNSSELIKTVTVDIFYYKRGDRLFDKETLYFNNIQPGNSLTVSKQGNRKAVTARFQLGQVNATQE